MKLVKLSEIFEVKYGTNLALNKLEHTSIHKPNYLPFVSRTSQNNGVSAYVQKLEDIRPNPPNTISVAGSGSVLSSFLHTTEYYSGKNLFFLKPKEQLTQKEMLFYCYCIEQNNYKYSHGRNANKTLAHLLVPDKNSIYRWVYETKIPQKPINKVYLPQKINLTEREWKYFYLEEIFDTFEKGKEIINETIKGSTFLISTSQFNNGVNCKIKAGKKLFPANRLTVATDGSVGSSFFQKKNFYAIPIVIILNNQHINIYNGLFLATIIEKEKYRFNYGRKWSDTRMKKSQIKLPIDNKKNPDWLFMENYIKSLPYSQGL